jgi:hypothetical protein
MSCFLFDFGYTFGVPLLASRRCYQTVAAFSVRAWNLPDFQLTPATVLDRMAPSLGFKAITPNSRPEFGKRYWLRGREDFRIEAVFADPLIDQLSMLDPDFKYSIEKRGDWLIIYQHGALADARSIAMFWHRAHQLAHLFLASVDP